MSLGSGAGVGGGTSNGGTGTGDGGSSGATGSQGNTSGDGASGGGNSGGASNSSSGGTGNTGSTGGSSGGMGTGATGGQQATWRDTLPDDLKADPTLSKYSDISNLAKAHIELQKKFGQKGVFKPAAGASADEIKAFREALGIPTDPEKYDMGDFDPSVKVDKSIVDWAKKIGAEQGIEPSAMKNIISDYMKVAANNEGLSAQAKKEAVKTGFDGLRKEWGEAFDQNLSRANFAIEKAPNGSAAVEALKKYGADNDPEILKVFNWVATLLGEDKLREGGFGNGRTTPAELDAEISQVQGQLLKLKPSDGAYQGLKMRYESLWKQKTGGR